METKQDYHDRMKHLKEESDKAVKEMLKQPVTLEQAWREQTNLRLSRGQKPIIEAHTKENGDKIEIEPQLGKK